MLKSASGVDPVSSTRVKLLIAALTLLLGLASATTGRAQSTTFTYQGQLNETLAAASGTYDFQFALFDLGGVQQGSVQTLTGVQVTAGLFAVSLDFGATPFAGGEDRYLEIRAKKPSEAGYTTLTPRQRITSVPQAIRAGNSATSDGLSIACNGCVSDANIASVSGAKITGTVAIANGGTGSPTKNFVDLTTLQANIAGVKTFTSPVNTSGDGYNINGFRAFTVNGDNVYAGLFAGPAIALSSNNSFVGFFAGRANTTGGLNSFLGSRSGQANTTGSLNSFFGVYAGTKNTTGSGNAFFGLRSGEFNLSGIGNAFFGTYSGNFNTTGDYNAFFGGAAGYKNTVGKSSSFFGPDAGYNNTTGDENTFIGARSGQNNVTGTKNTLIGSAAEVETADLSYATAIGADARTGASDTIVIGKVAGTYNSLVRPADAVQIPGSLAVTGPLTASGANVIGNLNVTGTLTKGAGSFKIDHPLDPENRYLSHSFVESPDMMNVYNGNIVTNRRGEAVVVMPDYFQALNRDFRYQLTVIGKFAQAIVLEKVKGDRFTIKTSRPNVEVSWQVTGIRQDKYANENRIPNAQDKSNAEKGTCLYAPLCSEKK